MEEPGKKKIRLKVLCKDIFEFYGSDPTNLLTYQGHVPCFRTLQNRVRPIPQQSSSTTGL